MVRISSGIDIPYKTKSQFKFVPITFNHETLTKYLETIDQMDQLTFYTDMVDNMFRFTSDIDQFVDDIMYSLYKSNFNIDENLNQFIATLIRNIADSFENQNYKNARSEMIQLIYDTFRILRNII
ncbi:MAG: hypothetical protein D6732_19150 [Methanobacteriota archaeon]|nr:MAG: hypothetical protein D6732_19150 [Euryarchaeota archaeon]